MANRFIQIPFEQLNPETLNAFLIAYLTRQGYDTTDTTEDAMQKAIDKVKLKLKQEELLLIFDQESQETELVKKQDAHNWLE